MYEKEIVEIEHLIQKQSRWKDTCINLIASENVMSQRARSQAGSDFAHREKRSVKEEVNRFRSEYQEVKYSFDELVRRKPELVEIKAT
jgi:hypothetical protein